MSHLILFGCWSLNSVCRKRGNDFIIWNDGTLTEIIAGIIPGRRSCYFYSSYSMEMCIYCCVPSWKKKKKCVILSLKNDTQHHWDPLQKPAATLSPIIHKKKKNLSNCFEVLPPVSLPWCSSFHLILLLRPLGTVALMCRLFPRSSDALLHLVFTVKLVAPVCADLAADLLCLVRQPGLAWNAKRHRQRVTPGGVILGRKAKYYLLLCASVCMCVHVPLPLNSAPSFVILARLKY